MRIGILRTDDVRAALAPDFGEYPDMFDRLLRLAKPDIETVAYNMVVGEYPADIDEVDGYLITGSKHSAYEDLEWIHALSDFIVALHARMKKLVGICFGHQLVAHALGGQTVKSPKGWGVGVARHSLNDEGRAFTGAADGFDVIVSHQDQVEEPATGARVLAGSAFCPIAMCAIDDDIFTMQGHPEFEPDYARRLFELRREQLGEAMADEAIESLASPVDRAEIARWIVEFY